MFKIDRVTNKNFVEVFNKLDSAAKFKIQLPDFFFDVEYYYDAKTGIITTQKQNFVSKIAFSVYESGFDYSQRKI